MKNKIFIRIISILTVLISVPASMLFGFLSYLKTGDWDVAFPPVEVLSSYILIILSLISIFLSFFLLENSNTKKDNYSFKKLYKKIIIIWIINILYIPLIILGALL